VALWREENPDVFAATIVTAAEQLRVQPLAVEKDYWVCEVLRTIAAHHRDEIVFKGGTSLEKLRIIKRFSEDLDLLVLGEFPNVRTAKRAMLTVLETAASTMGGNYTDRKSGGRLGTATQTARLALPLDHRGTAQGLADPTSVLIELGQAGGPNPALDGTVQSLLARQLAGAVDDVWDDLQPFSVSVLHPGRTLIEKLLRVNNFVVDPARRHTTHGLPRIGRQFYDIWALLGHDLVTGLLADTAMVRDIVASALEVSAHLDTPDHPVPDGGFAASAAFDPAGQFAEDLRREHDSAMTALFYGDDPPSFDDVLNRVHACAELLDPDRR